MALTEQEKEIVSNLKKQGFSTTEITGHLASSRAGKPSILSRKLEQRQTTTEAQPSLLRRIGSDIGEDYRGIGEDALDQFIKAGQNIVTTAEDPNKSIGDKIVGIGSEAYRRGGRFIGNTLLGGAKMLTTPEFEERVGTTAQNAGMSVAESRPAQALIQGYQSLPPEQQDGVRNALGFAEGGAEIFGAGRVTRGIREGIEASTSAVTQLPELSSKVLGGITVPDIKVGDPLSIFRRQPSSIDDVVEQASQNVSQEVSQNINLQNQNNINIQNQVNVPETKIDLDSVNQRLDTLIDQGKIAEARQLAEETAPKLTIAEKWTGVRPDIKNRIQGKSELMREYFDVTHARNSNDRVPGVQEYAASYALEAVDQMENQLWDTGGDIGKLREKLGSVQAGRSQVDKINSTWDSQLDSLNLQQVNGQIVQKPGTQSRLQAAGDLKVINDLNNELRVLKQNPSLTNIIDFRTNLDGRINFAKSAQEASSSVDGLSRSMRSQLAESANTIVGPSGAADVAKYSEFMTALNDLKSFTDRKAGAEYMLRLVLSGRGREARQIIDTVKDQTGIDLLDHATMMQISTELIANEAQKNPFRQELTKSGLDTARLLGGDPTGAAATIFQKGFERVVDPEKIFLEAAQ